MESLNILLRLVLHSSSKKILTFETSGFIQVGETEALTQQATGKFRGPPTHRLFLSFFLSFLPLFLSFFFLSFSLSQVKILGKNTVKFTSDTPEVNQMWPRQML